MTQEEQIFNEIYKKNINECIEHGRKYNISYEYSQQIRDDALTLTYFEIRDYRWKEAKLVKYATKKYLDYFSIVPN